VHVAGCKSLEQGIYSRGDPQAASHFFCYV
jgi:hypothetical protein